MGRELPKPMNDCVLLEVLESEVAYKPVDLSRGKEHAMVERVDLIVSTGDKMYKRARVVDVGPGKRHERTDALLPMFVEVGDLVEYEDWRVKWHTGHGVWPGPGDHALVKQEAIVAVIERADAWIEFARSHGTDAPAVPEGAFDMMGAGGSFRGFKRTA